MKGKQILAAFLLGVGLCFVPATSMAREPAWDGYLWNELSSRAKYCYIVGYADGIGKILGGVTIAGTLSIGKERFLSKDAFAMVKAIYEIHRRDYPGNFPEVPPIVRAVEAMDDLYKDRENRVILMRDAISVVCMRLRSEPEETINRVIERLRREAQGEEKEEKQKIPKPWHFETKKVSWIDFSLLEAKVEYVVARPNHFMWIELYYDPDGMFKDFFPEGVDTTDKIFVNIYDTRGYYVGVADTLLLDGFKTQLEDIHWFISMRLVDIKMATDIVATLRTAEDEPLAYFYQGEYHLWEK